MSGDQATAIVLYTVMKFDQCAEDAEFTFFIYFFTVLYCGASSYTILWYLNFSSVFHLLQDYFTVVK